MCGTWAGLTEVTSRLAQATGSEARLIKEELAAAEALPPLREAEAVKAAAHASLPQETP